MKLLIVAGGGGHFAPALAVIEKLPKDWEILVVGRKYVFEGDKSFSLEYQTAKKLGIPFFPLTTGRLQRKFTKHTINSLLKIPLGLSQATSILAKFKPDVVLSFGGYVSVPITLVASILRIPLVVHEQTLEAGVSNKLVAKFAKKICISWDQSAKFFPKEKIVLTGNPIRSVVARKNDEAIPKEIATLLAVARNDKGGRVPIIFITGGSSGAHAINVLIEDCLKNLLKNFYIIHQTGDSQEFKDFDRLTKLKESLDPNLQKNYYVKKFIEPDMMYIILNKADLVLSRSGIATVTELIYFGTPSILIPLPYGQHQEQLKNAQFIKKLGIAEIAEQDILSSEKLCLLIERMFDNINEYRKNAQVGKKLIDINAADKIIEVVADAGNKKKK